MQSEGRTEAEWELHCVCNVFSGCLTDEDPRLTIDRPCFFWIIPDVRPTVTLLQDIFQNF